MDLAEQARRALRAEMGRRGVNQKDMVALNHKQQRSGADVATLKASTVSRALQGDKPLKCRTADAMAAAMGLEFHGLALRLREVE